MVEAMAISDMAAMVSAGGGETPVPSAEIS